MASKTIRTRARALVADASWPVPYRETLNVDPYDYASSPAYPDVWSTLAFNGGDVERIGIGFDCERESGTMTFVFMARSGKGDAAAVDAADAARSAIKAWDWGPGALLLSVSEPQTFYDDSGDWFRADIDAEYQRDSG